MTYLNTMKSQIFFFMALKSWFMRFSTCFHGIFMRKRFILCDKKVKEIHLEVTSFRLSYSNDYLNSSLLWDVLEESLLIIVLWR